MLDFFNDYKYIEMVVTESKPKTKVFSVLAKNQYVKLGEIKWYAPWRQYCFIPENNTVYSKGCMIDINDFISKIMGLRKQKVEGV